MMKSFCVSLKSIRDITELVNIASDCEGHIELIQGGHRINAKSILGIFSLNMQEPVEINMEKENEEIECRLRERRIQL